MTKTLDRLKLLLALHEHSLAPTLVKSGEADKLMQLCNMMDIEKPPKDWYAMYTNIQKELVRNGKLFAYLPVFAAANIGMGDVDTLIYVLHEKGERVTDYPIGHLISALTLTINNAYGDAYQSGLLYNYLKHFSALPTTKIQKQTILSNLFKFLKALDRPMQDLSDSERALFLEPCLTSLQMAHQDINATLQLLERNPGLLSILRYLDENMYFANLTERCCKSMCESSDKILETIKLMDESIGRGATSLLLKRWAENDCPPAELMAAAALLPDIEQTERINTLERRSGYVNMLYKGKIKGIDLSEITTAKEGILIYALTHVKNGFIRLIEENYDIFDSLPDKSELFNQDFYADTVNINALNKKNLACCANLEKGSVLYQELVPAQEYTFDEIKALSGQPVQYYRLYAKLMGVNVDKRLLALRQLTKHNAMLNVTKPEQIDRLASKLGTKPLSQWLEKDFAHIAGLTNKTATELLATDSGIERFIPQMKDQNDAMISVKAEDSIEKYTTFDELKSGIIDNNPTWWNLTHVSDIVSDIFVENNRCRVLEFICNGNVEIAYKYRMKLEVDKEKKSFARIIKAELMGGLKLLKYPANDLRLEISYPLSDKQEDLWKNNTNIVSRGITVAERDDFASLMTIGSAPFSTCLAYDDGIYKRCLLSMFDSNKKVLYATINGKTVGRAIIRLTKGRFGKKEDDGNGLEFVDLENMDGKAESDEHLVLFLERAYTATIPPDTIDLVEDMFIAIASKKAELMGAMPVLSSSYGKSIEGYTTSMFRVYISKSKGGSQYLDSLGGSADMSAEGSYKSNSFLIRHEDLAKNNLY